MRNNYIIREARSWLGTPYRHQASCKLVGADCLGFIYGLYVALNPQTVPPLPPYDVQPQTGEGERLWRGACLYLIDQSATASSFLPDPAPGQVILFRMRPGDPARHMAVLLDDGNMAHAVRGRGVVTSRFGKWWRRRLVGVFSFPSQDLSDQQ